MAHNVKKEFELYEPMQYWLKNYLNDRYRGAHVITIDAHARTLDSFLEENGIIDQYPQTVGLDIQIDVLGLVSRKGKTDIVFIEAKKTQLNLRDLGQLWAYCKLCKPLEAFLLSSAGIGSLNKVLNHLSRQDLLEMGDGNSIRKMRVGKWDLSKKALDFASIIPKL